MCQLWIMTLYHRIPRQRVVVIQHMPWNQPRSDLPKNANIVTADTIVILAWGRLVKNSETNTATCNLQMHGIHIFLGSRISNVVIRSTNQEYWARSMYQVQWQVIISDVVGCGYLSLPLIPASGTTLLSNKQLYTGRETCSDSQSTQSTCWWLSNLNMCGTGIWRVDQALNGVWLWLGCIEGLLCVCILNTFCFLRYFVVYSLLHVSTFVWSLYFRSHHLILNWVKQEYRVLWKTKSC